MTRFPHVLAVLALAGSVLLVTACAPQATDAESKPTESAAAPVESQRPEPEVAPTSDPAAQRADPKCDTIISSTTIEDFESLGWTSLSDAFRVASVEIPEGVQCVWGDFSTASDHVQIFGWAPITADEATTAAGELVADGWRREEAPEGVYVTEGAETATATDEDGYGLTYLFGDGWVKYADTKQGLALVEWPPSC